MQIGMIINTVMRGNWRIVHDTDTEDPQRPPSMHNSWKKESWVCTDAGDRIKGEYCETIAFFLCSVSSILVSTQL